MIGYTGINHVALATHDMDATIRFWRDLLRMRLVAGLGRPGYRHYFLEISENDMIAFFDKNLVYRAGSLRFRIDHRAADLRIVYRQYIISLQQKPYSPGANHSNKYKDWQPEF